MKHLKKFTMFTNAISIVAAFVALASSAPAYATPSEHLNWGQNLAASETACPAGQAIVNVNQKIINDIDSKVAGGYWAYDEEVRHINVFDLGDGNYCATVKYQGSFETISGDSPQGTGAVGDGVVGTFQGGYTATFTADSFTPTVKTKGSIGTYDYECDPGTGDCPRYVSWLGLFFTSNSDFADFDLPWWGWVYHAGNNGSWVNAISGNSGDITGE